LPQTLFVVRQRFRDFTKDFTSVFVADEEGEFEVLEEEEENALSSEAAKQIPQPVIPVSPESRKKKK